MVELNRLPCRESLLMNYLMILKRKKNVTVAGNHKYKLTERINFFRTHIHSSLKVPTVVGNPVY